MLILMIGVGLIVSVVGGMLLVQPHVARRGLLFGVYVGEARWADEEARAITRRWTRWMVIGMAAAILGGLGPAALGIGPAPLGLLLSMVIVVLVSYGAYLRAYFQARALAVPGSPTTAAAALVPDPPHSLVLPLLSLVVALVGGSIAVSYAWLSYPHMPPMVPTHFGPSGRPDAWSPRSFLSVMLLPLGAFALPTALGLSSCLTARAKRAVRLSDKGVSVAAQLRFRQANASFLAGTTIIVSVMMATMAVFGVRTALGLSAGLPRLSMALAVVLVVYAIAGSLYIAFRLGQGGSRLERQGASAPLTNGVADNSHWYLGAFYVNRDDPSFLVEKRFGIGYTINFGNRWALVVAALFALLGVAVAASLLMPQTPTAPLPPSR